MPQTLILVLTGAVGAAGVKMFESIVLWWLSRRAAQEDTEDAEITALKAALQVILADRLQYLCRCYIRDGSVNYDDRRRLHKMHDAYHGVGGNGDLNTLMQAVDALPIQ